MKIIHHNNNVTIQDIDILSIPIVEYNHNDYRMVTKVYHFKAKRGCQCYHDCKCDIYTPAYNSTVNYYRSIAFDNTNKVFYNKLEEAEKAYNRSLNPETRTKALDWFNSLSLEEKFYQVIPWLKLKGLNVTSRHPNSLTGREIEDIYLNKQ